LRKLLGKDTITNTVKHWSCCCPRSNNPEIVTGPEKSRAFVASTPAVMQCLPVLSYCLVYWKLVELMRKNRRGFQGNGILASRRIGIERRVTVRVSEK